MKFGFYTPNFDYCGDAKLLAELAYEAEQASWDGFFIWDHLQVIEPAADPWVALAATAVRTEGIRLGPLSQVLGSAFAPTIATALYAATKTSNSIVAYLIAVSVISAVSVSLLPGGWSRSP